MSILRRAKQAAKALFSSEPHKTGKSLADFNKRGWEDFTPAEKDYINSLSIEFIFSEFGLERTNGGGTVFTGNRLDPSLSSLKKFFPQGKYTLFSDFAEKIEGVEVIKTASPFAKTNNPRKGYHGSDYFMFQGLAESNADVAITLDSDMFVTDKNIISLLRLTEKFGFCAPYNSRQLLRQDMQQSKDTQPITDNSLGFGRAYNQSPMTVSKASGPGKVFYRTCAEMMLEDPTRGSLAMWKAAWQTGLHPYVLPKQFCVCSGDEGCGDEVLLHVGHQSVADYYNIEL